MRLLILAMLFAGCANKNYYPEGLRKAQGNIFTKVYSKSGKLVDINGRYNLEKNIK